MHLARCLAPKRQQLIDEGRWQVLITSVPCVAAPLPHLSYTSAPRGLLASAPVLSCAVGSVVPGPITLQ